MNEIWNSHPICHVLNIFALLFASAHYSYQLRSHFYHNFLNTHHPIHIILPNLQPVTYCTYAFITNFGRICRPLLYLNANWEFLTTYAIKYKQNKTQSLSDTYTPALASRPLQKEHMLITQFIRDLHTLKLPSYLSTGDMLGRWPSKTKFREDLEKEMK
jgi:hypothetical protein